MNPRVLIDEDLYKFEARFDLSEPYKQENLEINVVAQNDARLPCLIQQGEKGDNP